MLKMEASPSTETQINIYQTVRDHTQQDILHLRLFFIPLFVSQAEIICGSSSLSFIYSFIMRKKQCMQLIAEYKWKIHWSLLSAQLGCKPRGLCIPTTAL